MPVRIYDISKKLGLENKQILAKAKSLGIAAARVPSSSLDKITAEFLEEELFKEYPELAKKIAAPPVAKTPKPARVEEKIVLITAPPPGPVTAWKSTEWLIMLFLAFLKWTSTVSPTRTRTNGPGTLPLKVQ